MKIVGSLLPSYPNKGRRFFCGKCGAIVFVFCLPTDDTDTICVVCGECGSTCLCGIDVLKHCVSPDIPLHIFDDEEVDQFWNAVLDQSKN